MLDKISNEQNDNNLDTFSKAVIYLAKDFENFDRFTTDEDLDTFLSNININASVLLLHLLPETISVNYGTAIRNTSKTFRNSISITVTPQIQATRKILSKFNNQEVFVCLQKEETQHLYGSTKEPLLCTYKELNSNSPGKIKGYSLSISGVTIEENRFVNIIDHNLLSRLLSSPLAAGL